MNTFFEEIFIFLRELFEKPETLLILFILGLGGLIPLFYIQFSFNPSDIWDVIWRFIATTWWFWLFFPFLRLFQSLLLFWRQEEYKAEVEYVVLEIKIPREILKSPKSMEQIFLIISSLYNVPTTAKAKYYEGEITVTFGFEMVSLGGQVHFYVRTPKKHKAVVESAFFSYYPDVELVEAPDYTGRFPQSSEEMYRSGLKVWGIEMFLAQNSLYPIKSYAQFESASEEKQLDPISSFLEVLGKAKPHEIFGIQILAVPAEPKWAEEYGDDLEDIRKKVSGSQPPAAAGGTDTATNAAWSPQPTKFEVLKAIEQNLTKPAFEVVIRLLYLAPEDNFSEAFFRSGIVSAFNQYAAVNLNAFRQNFGVGTNTGIWYPPYIFPEKRVEYRRQRMLFNYIKREMPQELWIGKLLTSHFYNWNFASKSFYLNVEGLATIFHLPPAIVLTAPHIERIESHKAGPSAGLSIFGEESEIEKFY